MSMSKCKCDKIFDTDEELEFDEKGDCCCDNCFKEIFIETERDMIEFNEYMKEAYERDKNLDIAGTMADYLLNMNYRKVR